MRLELNYQGILEVKRRGLMSGVDDTSWINGLFRRWLKDFT
jgi:hypothetical protein